MPAWPLFAGKTPGRNALCDLCCIGSDTDSDYTRQHSRGDPISYSHVCKPLCWCMGVSGIRTPADEVGARRQPTLHSGERNVPPIRPVITVTLPHSGERVGACWWCGSARPTIQSGSPNESRHFFIGPGQSGRINGGTIAGSDCLDGERVRCSRNARGRECAPPGVRERSPPAADTAGRRRGPVGCPRGDSGTGIPAGALTGLPVRRRAILALLWAVFHGRDACLPAGRPVGRMAETAMPR